jgi:hypothetical protein
MPDAPVGSGFSCHPSGEKSVQHAAPCGANVDRPSTDVRHADVETAQDRRRSGLTSSPSSASSPSTLASARARAPPPRCVCDLGHALYDCYALRLARARLWTPCFRTTRIADPEVVRHAIPPEPISRLSAFDLHCHPRRQTMGQSLRQLPLRGRQAARWPRRQASLALATPCSRQPSARTTTSRAEVRRMSQS